MPESVVWDKQNHPGQQRRIDTLPLLSATSENIRGVWCGILNDNV